MLLVSKLLPKLTVSNARSPANMKLVSVNVFIDHVEKSNVVSDVQPANIYLASCIFASLNFDRSIEVSA